MLTVTVESGPICDINTQNKNKTVFIDQKIFLVHIRVSRIFS